MKLAIISHTEHFLKNGQIVGWGSTVREINNLLSVFDEIWHIGVLYDESPPGSALPYDSDKIHFVPIPPFGGQHLHQKLAIIMKAPAVIRTVNRILRKVDYFQFRAPTGIGVYLIPYLTFFTQKPGWFKYAGNWIHPNPPLGYKWQRFYLNRLQSRNVTINGKWESQAPHCLSFENPCLTNAERVQGKEVISQKKYDQSLEVCFVGRLEDAKGVDRIIEAFLALPQTHPITKLHLVGDGPKRQQYEAKCELLTIPVEFHGFISQIQVTEVLSKCHIFLLPSDSEGFPKVIAEAANYGCIPIVSQLSCIDQYIIDKQSGYLIPMQDLNSQGVLAALLRVIENLDKKQIVLEAHKMAKLFTFESYNKQIADLINAF